jgi:hypothetical protein
MSMGYQRPEHRRRREGPKTHGRASVQHNKTVKILLTDNEFRDDQDIFSSFSGEKGCKSQRNQVQSAERIAALDTRMVKTQEHVVIMRQRYGKRTGFLADRGDYRPNLREGNRD